MEVTTMNTSERQRLSQLLKEVRGDASMRSFCAERDIHYSAWRQWEACSSVPGYENLEKVAALKGWSMNQLLAYLRTGDESGSPFDVDAFVVYIKNLPDHDRLDVVRRIL